MDVPHLHVLHKSIDTWWAHGSRLGFYGSRFCFAGEGMEGTYLCILVICLLAGQQKRKIKDVSLHLPALNSKP
jgi:hypothetical protein